MPGTLPLPAVVFVVSGGHSLLAMDENGTFRGLGQTIDDAAGEAYDKVARSGYPGGPVIDRLARDGDPAAVRFPRAPEDGSDDFSFSGLTAVLRHVREAGPDVNSVAASFQEAVVDVEISKVIGVAKREGLGTVLLGGAWPPTRACGPVWPPRPSLSGSGCSSPPRPCALTTGPWWPAPAASSPGTRECTPLDVGADLNLHIVPGFGRRAPRRAKRRR